MNKNKIVKPRHHKNLFMFIGIFGFLGLIFLIFSRAETNNTVSNTSNTNISTDCGNKISNYNYQVPFGNAVWNQNVCNLPRYANSAEYANRFLEWGHINDGSPEADKDNGKILSSPGFPAPTFFDPDGTANLWSREVYYASKATTTRKVTTTEYPSNLDGPKWTDTPSTPKPGHISYNPDTPIPWNPDWKTGMGGDNEIFILDDRPGPTEGRIYTIWGYNGNLVACAFSPDKVCGYAINIGRDHYGNIIDYRTHEGYVSERGVGLSYYATLTTPDEIAAGEIRHALGIAIPNTAFGPTCTPAQQGTAAEGYTCGTALAPASGHELASFTKSNQPEPYKSVYTLSKTIPEGMRFAINLTDSQIDQWIQSRSDLASNPRRAETARIFAKAIRNYGMIVVDTNGFFPGIQTVGGVNPDHKAKWIQLGMGPEYADNLLDGLVTKDNLYVVDPPQASCADGKTSKYFCKWISIKYAGTTPPPPPTYNPADFNKDSKVDILDLNYFVSNWDPNGAKPGSLADINKDGKVDILDLNFFVSNWTK